jgi:ferredoxin
MPKLTIEGQAVEVEAGKKLVLAIEEAGVNIGHRCGGYAGCTTCRVAFSDGEPTTMTAAEHKKLVERNLFGEYRLSCQIVCDHDMQIAEVAMTRENQGWTDTGPAPEAGVTPEATFFPISDLQSGSQNGDSK